MTRETALSVLNQWSDDPKENNAQLRRYVTDHGWLRADISKLAAYIRERRFRKAAVTDMDVYGIEHSGTVCMAGRANLHIPPNFQ
jgi:hypothetical protein